MGRVRVGLGFALARVQEVEEDAIERACGRNVLGQDGPGRLREFGERGGEHWIGGAASRSSRLMGLWYLVASSLSQTVEKEIER